MTGSLPIILALLLQLPVAQDGVDPPRGGNPDVLATQLFKASAKERAIFLDRPEFTTPAKR
jgi:hypothetical protein